ncbi:hypothetical protein [Streptomyces sp. NBC_01198]|uniref:hypothetical protein n=1 Tax=Streptomyces sp. NBC_01198 TaxID=2903769 RepID=UPI002E12301A|nr:hypothetical protein OG702_27940 [Streptomyces sp. NBC_01198]
MTDLPERLRNAADAHRPDRERMLARVEHAMAADGAGSGDHESGARGHDRPPAAPWMRVTAVTAAVAGAIGIGGLAVGAVTGDGQPAGTAVTSGDTGTVRPSPTAAGTSTGAGARVPVPHHGAAASGHHKTSATPRATGSGRTPTVPPSDPSPPATAHNTSPGPSRGQVEGPESPASNGPLSSNGAVAAASNDYWTQSDVQLTTDQTLTSLTVELRVARNNGETSTGSYTALSDRTSARMTVEGHDLVYRWTLNAGQTLGPGAYTFSAQFNHDQGQGGTDGDRYTVTAGYGSGATATVGGGF